jgi:hypothetical protein
VKLILEPILEPCQIGPYFGEFAKLTPVFFLLLQESRSNGISGGIVSIFH